MHNSSTVVVDRCQWRSWPQQLRISSHMRNLFVCVCRCAFDSSSSSPPPVVCFCTSDNNNNNDTTTLTNMSQHKLNAKIINCDRPRRSFREMPFRLNAMCWSINNWALSLLLAFACEHAQYAFFCCCLVE